MSLRALPRGYREGGVQYPDREGYNKEGQRGLFSVDAYVLARVLPGGYRVTVRQCALSAVECVPVRALYRGGIEKAESSPQRRRRCQPSTCAARKRFEYAAARRRTVRWVCAMIARGVCAAVTRRRARRNLTGEYTRRNPRTRAGSRSLARVWAADLQLPAAARLSQREHVPAPGVHPCPGRRSMLV